MTDRIFRQVEFLCEADRLKSVLRANNLMDQSRSENSAEHSWHVALYAMLFGASDRAIAMLLLHDLVEIDAGDHPIHIAHDTEVLTRAEADAAARIFGLADDASALAALWAEFEAATTPDAIVAKRLDHIQPLFQVLFAAHPVPEHLQICRDNIGTGRAARLRSEWPEAIALAQAMLDRQALPASDLGRRLAFLAEADRLKGVQRANTLIDASRSENSAEHSWHVALYTLLLADLAGPGVDVSRVIRMLLIHDLVEIDVGDVPLHSDAGQTGVEATRAAERAAAHRIFGLLPPAQAAEFLALWSEFEDAKTPDAIFARAMDRCQPAMQLLRSGGDGWRRYGAGYDQVASREGARIVQGAPRFWEWLDPQLQAHFR